MYEYARKPVEKIERINIQRGFGMIKVFDADMGIIATFSDHPETAKLFALLKAGMFREGSYEMFDLDKQEYLIGTLAQIQP